MTQRLPKSYCLNCDTTFPESVDDQQEYFCPNCGQSNKESRLSFFRLIKDAISNVFNLDSRLIHTVRDIFHPSRLARTYIEGKRKYYVNPARLFIFTLIALVTFSVFTMHFEKSAMGVDRLYSNAERSKMLDEFNSLVDTLDIKGNEPFVDSMRTNLFRKVRSLKTDTLGKNVNLFASKGRSIESFGISSYDGVHLDQDSLFKKYQVVDFWDKIKVGQFIRVRLDPAGGIKYAVKNITWAIFITVVLISFLLKLLYIRSSYYLVEHVVLILYSHSLLFMLFGLNLFINEYVYIEQIGESLKEGFAAVSILFVFIIQFLSIKKYYRQGFFKTLIKQIIINIAYIFIFISTVITVAIISLILY
ncbi:MAG: DUF3667 domain-containing protein [Saprospiraceae bacterium]|nr:DUF3667 domain-containing protein [Saprospiraceae bacterium]